MRKENVFLVTGSSRGPAEVPQRDSVLEQRVICAANEGALYEFLGTSFPNLQVVGVVSLAALEATVAQVKQALAGVGDIAVFVDPAMAC